MNSSASKYVAISAISMIGIFALPRTVVAAIDYASFATIELSGTVRLQAVTFNTSPNDRAVVATIGVRGNRFTGPGYSELGFWYDQVLDADILVVVDERFRSSPGTYCVTGQHRWTTRTNVTFLRSSQKKCVTKSGGGGGCAIANPETSILSLSGERTTLPAAALNPLTRRGVAEDTRSIVLDEYALVNFGLQGASFKQVSEDFQVTPSLVSTLTRSSSAAEPAHVAPEPAEGQLVDVAVSSRGDPKHARAGSGAMLVIQHQCEHPANERFAPVPHVTFAPQILTSSTPQERRGFAIVDFGESGRILHVDAISENGGPAGAAIVAAISNALSSQFSDERLHDHRLYLAYEIDGGMLRGSGSPFVTMPMCCPCPPPPYLCP